MANKSPVEKELNRLAQKLASFPDKTQQLCDLTGMASPSVLKTWLSTEECYLIVADEICDHLKEILACKEADQQFIDMIVSDIDTIRNLRKIRHL